MGDKPVMVACIPACDEERAIGGVVVRAMKRVDKAVVCDDGSVGPTGEIVETTCFYVSRSMSRCGGGYVRQG